MLRGIFACRIHHFLDRGELHKKAGPLPGIGAEFAGVDEDSVFSGELHREVSEEPFFNTRALPDPVDEPEYPLAADDLQNESEQAVRQRFWREADVADPVTAFEQANDQAAVPH